MDRDAAAIFHHDLRLGADDVEQVAEQDRTGDRRAAARGLLDLQRQEVLARFAFAERRRSPGLQIETAVVVGQHGVVRVVADLLVDGHDGIGRAGDDIRGGPQPQVDVAADRGARNGQAVKVDTLVHRSLQFSFADIGDNVNLNQIYKPVNNKIKA